MTDHKKLQWLEWKLRAWMHCNEPRLFDQTQQQRWCDIYLLKAAKDYFGEP